MSAKQDKNLVNFISKISGPGGMAPEVESRFEAAFQTGLKKARELQAEGKPEYLAWFPSVRRIEILFNNRDAIAQDRAIQDELRDLGIMDTSEYIEEIHNLIRDYFDDNPEMAAAYKEWKQEWIASVAVKQAPEGAGKE